jgi:hypothetical protein
MNPEVAHLTKPLSMVFQIAWYVYPATCCDSMKRLQLQLAWALLVLVEVQQIAADYTQVRR